jgi:transcriptional regulator with XRE-family HTH domain
MIDYMDVRVQFGVRLRSLRKGKGWTIVEMAEILGLERSYLNEIELGRRNPCLITLKTIADGFKISISKLCSRI